MYHHHLQNMADNLIEKGLIHPVKKDDAIEAMGLEWKDQQAISWCIGDIHAVAKSAGLEISNYQAREILETIVYKHDASLGICWDTIEAHLIQYDSVAPFQRYAGLGKGE